MKRKYPPGTYAVRHRVTGQYATLRHLIRWQTDRVNTTEEGMKRFVRMTIELGFHKMIRPQYHHVKSLFDEWVIVAGDVEQPDFVRRMFGLVVDTDPVLPAFGTENIA
jgi:hypothetical protein